MTDPTDELDVAHESWCALHTDPERGECDCRTPEHAKPAPVTDAERDEAARDASSARVRLMIDYACLLRRRIAELEAEVALQTKLKREACYQAELEAMRANDAEREADAKQPAAPASTDALHPVGRCTCYWCRRPQPAAPANTESAREAVAHPPCEWCGATEGAHGDAYVCIVADPDSPDGMLVPGTAYLPSRAAIVALLERGVGRVTATPRRARPSGCGTTGSISCGGVEPRPDGGTGEDGEAVTSLADDVARAREACGCSHCVQRYSIGIDWSVGCKFAAILAEIRREAVPDAPGSYGVPDKHVEVKP